jgi:hypothetical protein
MNCVCGHDKWKTCARLSQKSSPLLTLTPSRNASNDPPAFLAKLHSGGYKIKTIAGQKSNFKSASNKKLKPVGKQFRRILNGGLDHFDLEADFSAL